MFIGPHAVRVLTPKWTLFVAWFFYGLHVAANLYPRWWTLIPSAVLSGTMGGMVWIAHGIYITSLAIKHAENTGAGLHRTLANFNGITFAIFSLTHVVGNLMSALILSLDRDEIRPSGNQTDWNGTHFVLTSKSQSFSPFDDPSYSDSPDTTSTVTVDLEKSPAHLVCGADHCPYLQENEAITRAPGRRLVIIVMCAYLLSNVIGQIITLFLRNVTIESHSRGSNSEEPAVNLPLRAVLRTVTILKDWRLLLLIPALSVIGVFPAITTGGYTQVSL